MRLMGDAVSRDSLWYHTPWLNEHLPDDGETRSMREERARWLRTGVGEVWLHGDRFRVSEDGTITRLPRHIVSTPLVRDRWRWNDPLPPPPDGHFDHDA